MKFLYSNILPMRTEDSQQTMRDCIEANMADAEEVLIAVGYVTAASLEELDRLVEVYQIPKITLTIGMYFIDGMPESSYHTAMDINKKWKERGIGGIRMVKSFKYHGKLYLFLKEDMQHTAVAGSANLSVLKPDASTLRQYESGVLVDDAAQCLEIQSFLKKLAEAPISEDIARITEMPLIREENRSLTGIELVSQVPPASVQLYEKHKTETKFRLPLKVPAEAEKLLEGRQYYTKSNINVCYAAPRNRRKPRDWFETQLTVSRIITAMEGYPQKNIPFFIVTDDGYWFKAHTTSSGNKQFSAVGDELIMGRWLKGRLAAAGLVKPVNDTGNDPGRTGMITKEMLAEYGCSCLVFSKTDQKAVDEDGTELDVWVLSFR